ncbi:hypothetical protein A4V34_05400 [Listeria monocytogenes]|nr:hypothetical protein [Listeria monocytogenes]EIO5735567.1 hypothetical protein [Listeria monocytogenes]
MDGMKAISYIELYQEAEECYKILYRFINSPKDIQSILIPPMIPFLSLISVGIDSFVEFTDEYPQINGYSFKSLIGSSRAKTKLLSDKRLQKSMNIINETLLKANKDLRTGYNSIQFQIIEDLGQEDLGVFYYKNTPIANSLQMYVYLAELMDIDDGESLEGKYKDTLINFSSSLSNHIYSFVLSNKKDFEDYIDDNVQEINIKENDLSMADYFIMDTKRRNYFRKDFEESFLIYVFNFLCNINYTLYIIPLIIDNKKAIYYRFKLITYITTVEALSKLAKNHNMSSVVEPINSQLSIIIERKRQIISSNLRNNLFHFEIPQGDFPLEWSGNIFENLIEYQTKMKFNIFNETIDNELNKIAILIKEWIY